MSSSSSPSLNIGDNIPAGISVDIIAPTADDVPGSCSFNVAENFYDILKGINKVILFAVPGAFTPTCSEKHLPSFIINSNLLKAKGVDEIYCLSVNDKYVMKAWGLSTPGFIESGIKLVADGNGELTKAYMQMQDI